MLDDRTVWQCAINSFDQGNTRSHFRCFRRNCWFTLGPLTPFFRTYQLLNHKFENMVIFRSGNLYSLRRPANQDYHKIIYFFNFFIKKLEIGDESYFMFANVCQFVNLYLYTIFQVPDSILIFKVKKNQKFVKAYSSKITTI